MILEFEAKSASYQEALVGEIRQAIFEEDPDCDPISSNSKNLSFSINYEFPPRKLFFEWCDGSNFGGNVEAINYSINNSEIIFWLKGDITIRVKLPINLEIDNRIFDLLKDTLGDPIKT